MEILIILFQFLIIGVFLIPAIYLFRLVVRALKVYIEKNSK